jgi:hypothetical protein
MPLTHPAVVTVGPAVTAAVMTVIVSPREAAAVEAPPAVAAPAHVTAAAQVAAGKVNMQASNSQAARLSIEPNQQQGSRASRSVELSKAKMYQCWVREELHQPSTYLHMSEHVHERTTIHGGKLWP